MCRGDHQNPESLVAVHEGEHRSDQHECEDTKRSEEVTFEEPKQEKPEEEARAFERSLKLLDGVRLRYNEVARINSGRDEGNPSPSTLD